MSAEALVVPSRAVVATDAFKKQARTSERWLRLLEVGVSDLGAFLQEQREQGYTIIGGLRLHLGFELVFYQGLSLLRSCDHAS
jgi:hypothetical protein